MKKVLTAVLLCAACVAVLDAAEKAYPSFCSKSPSFKIIVPNTISVKFEGASNPSNSAKDAKWLGFEFAYTARKAAKDESRYLDNVKVVGTVAMESETPAGKPTLAVFSGEATLWHIALDGKSRKIMMLIPPQVVNRYLPVKQTLAKAMAFARIQIYDEKGQLLGVEYATLNKVDVVKADDVMVDFQRIDRDANLGYRVNGALLQRSRTPWALYDFYNYDLEKDPVAPAGTSDESSTVNGK